MAALAQFVAMADAEITTLRASVETLAQLSEMLIEVVANGGSVSFMHPLGARGGGRPSGTTRWPPQARNERVVLGAWDGDVLVGTVTLLLDFPPNQPHRAEIAKLMTRMGYRGRGVATSLMQAAETHRGRAGPNLAGARHRGRRRRRHACISGWGSHWPVRFPTTRSSRTAG